jgi:hypothetical protein
MEFYKPQLQYGGKVYQPGIYDIPNEEYHASAGVSRSAITEFMISPLHYWDRYINPDKPKFKKSKSFDIGTATHTYLLENKKFNESYVIMPTFSGKGMKAAQAEFKAQHKGKEFISQKDFDNVMGIVRSVEKHATAKDLIIDAVYEKSIYWIDEDTGLLCKARPDIWHSSVIADIKTTECARENRFQYSISDYGYHIQAAMILDAVKKMALEEHMNFFFIAAETKRPYPVVSYPLNSQSIYQGKEEYKSALHKMKECFDKNEWPGYEDKEISLPRNRLTI